MVVAVIVLPVVWVWSAGFDEASQVDRQALELAALALAVADAPDTLDLVASTHRARVRLLDGSQVMQDADGEPDDPWHAPVSNPFYGPEGRPDPRRVDATLPTLHTRPEVVRARADGVAQRCSVSDAGWMLVCAAAASLPDGRVVHVQRTSARLIKSLYEDRYPLTAVMLVVLGVGVLLSLWLGWRMVGPIEHLRDQVVERTRGRVSTKPVVLDRADELGDLARAFNQLLAALDARNRANESFAADLAHELKNPVAAVRAAAEAMAADRPLEGRRRERLTRVLADSSHRMQVVIDRFLDLARAEAGLIATERESVDLAALVRAIVEPLTADPRFGGLSFDVQLPDGAWVWAAPERLETALRNLIGNAASFAESRVIITGSIAERRAVVCVADDGPGIPQADLDQIFVRYFTTRDTGTGLGLALVRAIVEAHGGMIEAHSEPGEGAQFTIRLPRDSAIEERHRSRGL
ncbi:MAG: signal transduction histidine kinase [Myxococcota bacterium]